MTKILPRGERRENLLRVCGTSIPKQETFGWAVGQNPNEDLTGSRIRKEGSNILLVASTVAASTCRA
jgi:hypothetical protein